MNQRLAGRGNERGGKVKKGAQVRDLGQLNGGFKDGCDISDLRRWGEWCWCRQQSLEAWNSGESWGAQSGTCAPWDIWGAMGVWSRVQEANLGKALEADGRRQEMPYLEIRALLKSVRNINIS